MRKKEGVMEVKEKEREDRQTDGRERERKRETGYRLCLRCFGFSPTAPHKDVVLIDH